MKYIKYQIDSESAYEWLSWCEKELYKLNQSHKLGTTTHHFYQFINSIYAELIVRDVYDTIRLWGTSSGFICHPRNDTFPGGITTDKKNISPAYSYPLLDDDQGSFVLTPSGTPPEWTVSRDVENYGNIDWQGEDGTILSWRGPASRHFPLDTTINYLGFTFHDETLGEPPFETEYFTPFSSNVYQSGSVLDTLEGTKILGAAICKGLLTVVASSNFRGATNFDGTVGGFYDGVWQRDGEWKLLWHKLSSRPQYCWFFTSDGLKAYRQNEVLDFAGNTPVYIQTPELGGAATLISNYPTTFNLIKQGEWTPYREINQIRIKLESIDITDSQAVSDTIVDSVPVYVLTDAPPPAALAISGPTNYTQGAYSASGGEEPYTFTEPNPTSCGTQSVLVTDSCGNTASMQVLMPNGTWVVSLVEVFTPFSYMGRTYNCAGLSIDTRSLVIGTNYIVELSCEDLNYDNTYCPTDGITYPLDAGPLPHIPMIPVTPHHSNYTVPNACNAAGATYYPYTCSRTTYTWECP